MELKALGFDRWFQEQYGRSAGPGFSFARITAVDRDRYLVRNEAGEVSAEPAGGLMFSVESSEDLPCVGDWVRVQYHNDGAFAIVHEVFPRRTVLRRKSAGADIRHQLIAANVDYAFIVQSCDSDFNIRRLERYLVVVSEGGIEPVVLLSKSDLVGSDDLEPRMAEIRGTGVGGSIVAFSNKTGFGLDRVHAALEKAKTHCLLGSSGVGKTTLLNRLMDRELFETKSVRDKDGKGRHTTARRQLILLDNGAMIIDNPGMRELGIIGVGAGIDESFSDIHELSQGCRFRDCTHTREAGCSILTAVESGSLSRDRYESYLKLRRESEYHQMSYVEKRRKDRKFGRFIKSVMKHKKR